MPQWSAATSFLVTGPLTYFSVLASDHHGSTTRSLVRGRAVQPLGRRQGALVGMLSVSRLHE
jgi:hypothetical protein